MAPSSVIADFEYDEQSEELEVRLVNGARYRYFDVPPEVHEEFRQADSKGRYYNREIRASYEYERLD